MGNGASEATGLNVDSDRAPSRAKFANSSGSERTSGRARRTDEVHTLTTLLVHSYDEGSAPGPHTKETGVVA